MDVRVPMVRVVKINGTLVADVLSDTDDGHLGTGYEGCILNFTEVLVFYYVCTLFLDGIDFITIVSVRYFALEDLIL